MILSLSIIWLSSIDPGFMREALEFPYGLTLREVDVGNGPKPLSIEAQELDFPEIAWQPLVLGQLRELHSLFCYRIWFDLGLQVLVV